MTATSDQLLHHLKVMKEKGIFDDQAALFALHQSSCFTDVLEAAKRGTLPSVDTEAFKRLLGLIEYEGPGMLPSGLAYTKSFKVLLGNYRNGSEYVAALEGASIKETRGVFNFLSGNEFRCIPEKTPINLIVLPLRSLGFKLGRVGINSILAAGRSYGLLPCEPEDGPALRLLYRSQPLHENIWLAMNPLFDRAGMSYVFRLERSEGGGLWLGDDWAHPRYGWVPEDKVVLRLRKL